MAGLSRIVRPNLCLSAEELTMAEMDLKKLNWNPDSCGCKLEITKGRTEEITKIEFPQDTQVWKLQRGIRPNLVRSALRKEIVYEVPLYRTNKTDRAGNTLEEEIHEIPDLSGAPLAMATVPKVPPRGNRLRAQIVEVCPKHKGMGIHKDDNPIFWYQDKDGDYWEAPFMLQTQRLRADPCKCSWQELRVGNRQEGVLFGHFVEYVCELHHGIPFADLPTEVRKSQQAAKND